MQKPYVWQMVKEAIENLKGRASYAEIKSFIHSKWNDVNESTINAQIIVLTVNHTSRIHYPENRKPRISNTQYDLLFTTGRGQVVKYNPDEHGVWEIFQNEFGGLGVRQVINEEVEIEDFESAEESSFLFPIEANLRDFLIKNINTFKEDKLKLFIDENGRDGKEYPTEVGFIDILAVDKNGNFVVFELKLSKGPDRALGQLLRYMGWVQKLLANGKNVKGVIVANKMDDKLKFAVSMTPNVQLFEYEMKFELKKLDVK